MARGISGFDRFVFPHARHVVEGRPIVRNFFGDRCPHLAAMLAYYALLSLAPMLFLLLSLVGLLGDQSETSELITAVRRVIPGGTASQIVDFVDSLQRNSARLGLIGLIGLIWSALGFLSALESAFNIIYDLPNRPFVRQKVLMFTLFGATLAVAFGSLIAWTTAEARLEEGPDFLRASVWRVSLSFVLSTAVVFGFLFAIYRLLPNTPLTAREVLPGSIVSTLLLVVSVELIPWYISYVDTQPVLKAAGGALILLVWLYLMGNILLIGAEINWWVGRGRALARAQRAEDEAIGHA